MPPNNVSAGHPVEADTITRAGDAALRPPAVVLVPGLTVLFHPRPDRIGERVALPGLASGQSVPLSRLEPAFSQPGSEAARPLEDPYLSRQPLLLLPGSSRGAVGVDAQGSPTAVALDGVPLAGRRELTAAELARGAVLLLAGRVVLLLSMIDPLVEAESDDLGLAGASAPMSALRRQIRRVACLPMPVLLRGETGTGKELAARAVHHLSSRRARPYVAVNMAAIPPTLAAAELFGAARGAWSGADRERIGYFARARGGTLFLDEIGETPLEVQAMLLRALESGEIQPLGGAAPLVVDVRLIAATDTDLEAAVAAGRFRAPLLHRLAGYEIRLPALRDRREDLGRLLHLFLRQELEAAGRADRLAAAEPSGRPWLPAALVARLALHPWPGNVRQLRYLARRLAAAGESEEPLEDLVPDDLPAAGRASVSCAPEPASLDATRRFRDPGEVSEAEMLAALEAHQWRIQRAAASLGLSRTSLYSKIGTSQLLRKAADLGEAEITAALADAGGDLSGAASRLRVSHRGLLLRMRQLRLEPRR